MIVEFVDDERGLLHLNTDEMVSVQNGPRTYAKIVMLDGSVFERNVEFEKYREKKIWGTENLIW